MSVSRTCTKRPVAVAMLILAVVLLGSISWTRLPIDLLPEISFPRLIVYTSYPDVAPAEIERLVTEPVERQAAAVAGVEKVTSVSQDGVSLVTLRFVWGTNMDFAALSLRERLDNIRYGMPDGASRPTILRVDPQSDPVMAVSLTGGSGLLHNKQIAERVFRRRLEQLDGVAQASVTGGLDREIHVEYQPPLLDAYEVSASEVVSAIDGANYSSLGGTILQGRYRYPLRTLGEFQDVEEIRDVVVGRQQVGGGGGAGAGSGDEDPGFRQVRVRDVATVIDGFADRQEIARYNGAESVGLLVFKESGANTVRVSEQVREVLELLKEQYPDFSAEIAYDQAIFIDESISNVAQALMLGGLLAFVVLFFFLRDPRYPVAIALAIPISVIGAFALMDAFGVSLNIMSLGGLALGVGMLVDNSIIVLENIFRHRQSGLGALEAAALGAEEVQGAITASTLTTISVFGPIIYVQGVAGELFGALSLAVAFSLLASLAVALTLLPTMAARFGGLGADAPVPADAPEREAPVAELPPEAFLPRLLWRLASWCNRFFRLLLLLPFAAIKLPVSIVLQLFRFWMEIIGKVLSFLFSPFLGIFDRAFNVFARWYHGVLAVSLERRATVLVIAAGALGGSVALAVTLDRDLLPDVDQGAFTVRMELDESTRLEATADAATRLEAELLQDEGVAAVFSHIGRDVQAMREEGATAGLHTATLQIRLEDGARTEDVVNRVQSAAADFPPGALTFETGQATALGRLLGGSEADIAVRIFGPDLDLAHGFAQQVRERLSGVTEIRNVRVGAERGRPQFQVQIDPEAAARYGIATNGVATTIQTAMLGARATEFIEFDRKIPVMVRLPEHLRHDPATLRDLRVGEVPLENLATVQETLGPAEIRREEQGRVVTVYADVASGGLGGAITAVETAMADLTPPFNHRLEVGGENEEMRRSFSDLAFAFGLALLLVYMILAAQFESFVHPFTILMAVPLAVIGAVLALVLTGAGLNTMSLIGMVILVGIVVNDSIVKVDFINQGIARGLGLRDAILEAGQVRLRPIVMTTITTVLGLLPMALGIGRGADLRAPMAISVIGGLIVATALTLIVVPVVYAIVEDTRRMWRRRRSAAAAARSVIVPQPAEST